jgi:hypothetical protein
MSDRPARRLSGEELVVLRFAAHRQLARWARRRDLDARRRAQRAALVRAVRTLEDGALAHGCELRPAGDA